MRFAAAAFQIRSFLRASIVRFISPRPFYLALFHRGKLHEVFVGFFSERFFAVAFCMSFFCRAFTVRFFPFLFSQGPSACIFAALLNGLSPGTYLVNSLARRISMGFSGGAFLHAFCRRASSACTLAGLLPWALSRGHLT